MQRHKVAPIMNTTNTKQPQPEDNNQPFLTTYSKRQRNGHNTSAFNNWFSKLRPLIFVHFRHNRRLRNSGSRPDPGTRVLRASLMAVVDVDGSSPQSMFGVCFTVGNAPKCVFAAVIPVCTLHRLLSLDLVLKDSKEPPRSSSHGSFFCVFRAFRG